MKKCNCEHWQSCQICYPQAFDAEGNRLPPQPTPLQAARIEIKNLSDKNSALELCIARHSDEMYSLNKEIATLKNCLFQAQEAAKAEGEANDKLQFALENCRLLAARHRKEDWALLILGFCAEGGVVGSVTRDIITPVGKESQAVCDSILKDTYK